MNRAISGRPAGTQPPELSWEKLDRLDCHLWMLAILLIFVLAVGLLSFMFPSVFWFREEFAVQTLQRAFFGFCVLLSLVLVYLLQRQATVRQLKRQLFEARAVTAGAKRTSELKDQFLATMSHELRTPLNAILGFSGLLSDERHGTLNERQGGYVNNIHSAGQHLLRLINEILDLSRIEAGRMELVMENVSVQMAFSDVVETLIILAEEKSQTLSHDTDSDLIVRADPIRLKQVLLNLVGNAIKFTLQGGKIELRARRENGRVRLEIRDNGPGIPLEERQHIFDAFHRLHQSGEIEGTGLGLAIAQRLVAMQGGCLGVESQPGQGSLFYFTLPAAEQVLKKRDRSVPSFLESSGEELRILVIENDPTAARLIQSHLVSSGYEVIICDQPERAADMAGEHQPHAITLDLLMRPTSGWDVLFQLKLDLRTRQIPVVVVTILDQPARGAAYVADEYLVKPVEKATLLAAINRCLAARGMATPSTRPILIVEDDPSVREALAEVLSVEGLPVVTTADGLEARNWVAKSLPELVVLDLMLPKVSGFELLAEWRATPRTADLPVFVLTGKELTPNEEKCLRAHSESLYRKQAQWKDDLVQQLRRVVNPQLMMKPIKQRILIGEDDPRTVNYLENEKKENLFRGNGR
ncbi:MAG: response regulator [Acidobacteria bacterium]|nr:response regulator [Acidobacteriota bacterium]